MKEYYWELTVQPGQKFDPNQPRIPAGEPRGGQWTRAGSSFSDAVTSGNIETSNPLGGGVCASRILKYKDDGQGVWKALTDDYGSHDGMSEVAAYRISELLGLDIVPETVFAENDRGEPGTSQEFIENSRVGYAVAREIGVNAYNRYAWHMVAKRIAEYSPDNQERMEKMALLDYVIGNGDRHMGNVVIDPEGKIWAIDHGHSAWNDYNRMNTITNWFDVRQRYQLSDSLVKKIKQVNFDDFMEALSDVRTSGNVSIDAAWQRIIDLKRNGGMLE